MMRLLRLFTVVALSISSIPAAASMELLVGTGPGELGAPSPVHRFQASDSAYLGTLLACGGAPSSGAYGIAVGQDGDIYVSSYFTNEVMHYDKATGNVTAIDVSAHVSGPHGLAVGLGANNYLYVASSNTGEIVQYDPAGNYVGVFAGGISNVSGLEFCVNGNLYVGQIGTEGPTADSAILKFNSSGTSRWDFNTGAELNDPWGLASYDDALGYLYVASRENNSVLRYIRSTRQFDPTWSLLTADGSAPYVGLASPSGVAVDALGDLYVSDWGNDQILKFNGATGEFLEVWASVEKPLYLKFAPPVPEPSSILALCMGAAGLVTFASRRKT